MQDIKDIRADIKEFGKSLARVEYKVFNGFGVRIEQIKNDLEAEKACNDSNHKDLAASISTLQKFIFGSMVTIFLALISVFVMLYTTSSKTESHVQKLEDTIVTVLMWQDSRILENSGNISNRAEVPHDVVPTE